jgi:HAD superfamily hydrolase (TIGR01450 family)
VTETPLKLIGAYDVLLVDLDGVVYLGKEPIPGAAAALNHALNAGIHLVFVTNNAARPPRDVAAQLSELGVSADADDVMTAATAAANDLASRHAAGSPVLVVGGAGVREALSAAGLEPVDSAEDHPVAVLQGFAPDVGWSMLAEATVAIRAGAEWVASNADTTLPSPRGPLPGNGSLVAAVATATGTRPRVIGKPEPALFAAALAVSGGKRPLVVGDRLDTDIAGAVASSLPSLLVLTGVSSATDLLAAPVDQRPTYIGRDLGVLIDADGDGLDGLRALCADAWAGRLDPAQYDKAIEKLDLNLR